HPRALRADALSEPDLLERLTTKIADALRIELACRHVPIREEPHVAVERDAPWIRLCASAEEPRAKPAHVIRLCDSLERRIPREILLDRIEERLDVRGREAAERVELADARGRDVHLVLDAVGRARVVREDHLVPYSERLQDVAQLAIFAAPV